MVSNGQSRLGLSSVVSMLLIFNKAMTREFASLKDSNTEIVHPHGLIMFFLTCLYSLGAEIFGRVTLAFEFGLFPILQMGTGLLYATCPSLGKIGVGF